MRQHSMSSEELARSPLNLPIMRRLEKGPADTHELMSITRLSATVLSGRLQRLRRRGLIERVARKRVYRDGVCIGAIWVWRKADKLPKEIERVESKPVGLRRYYPEPRPLSYDMHAHARLNAR